MPAFFVSVLATCLPPSGRGGAMEVQRGLARPTAPATRLAYCLRIRERPDMRTCQPAKPPSAR